jgi:predicted acetyltransferase
MTQRPVTPAEAGPTTLEPVTRELLPLVERLWQLYRYDLSEFRDSHPDEDGLFKAGRLPTYLVEDDPGHAALLVRHGGRPAGLVLLGGLQTPPATIGEFFVVRSVRRSGVGHHVATEVMRSRPGPWLLAFQEENPRAARFWRRLAPELAGDTWSERRVPVPDKPWLPPDVWLSLEVAPPD